jgi:hypothetical protein
VRVVLSEGADVVTYPLQYLVHSNKGGYDLLHVQDTRLLAKLPTHREVPLAEKVLRYDLRRGCARAGL